MNILNKSYIILRKSTLTLSLIVLPLGYSSLANAAFPNCSSIGNPDLQIICKRIQLNSEALVCTLPKFNLKTLCYNHPNEWDRQVAGAAETSFTDFADNDPNGCLKEYPDKTSPNYSDCISQMDSVSKSYDAGDAVQQCNNCGYKQSPVK